MRASGFDAPVGHFTVPVVVAHLPGVVFVGDDDTVFGNHVGTWNQADPVVGHPSVHFHHIAQFDERVAVVIAFQCQPQELLKPGSFQQFCQFRILHTLCIAELETFVQHKSHALLHASGQVQVGIHIGIKIQQTGTVWVVYVDSHLPCTPPVGQVAPCQCFGKQLELDAHFLDAPSFGGIHPVEIFYFRFLCHNRYQI